MSLTRLLNALPEPLFSRYSLDKVLGVGAYAVVYQIREKKTSELFALKVIEIEPMRARLMLDQLDREVAFLEEFSSTEHIVELLEVTKTKTHIFLRFELCQMSLEDVATKQGAMKEKEAFDWIRMVCLGVQGLHAEGAVHRDLKPSNLLVDSEGSLRICDFGWACRETDMSVGVCGSPQYAPPEQVTIPMMIHTSKSDMYSLGATLQHFYLGRIPYSRHDWPHGRSEEGLTLIAFMMNPAPQLRPSAEQLLMRPELASSVFDRLWKHGNALFSSMSSDSLAPAMVTSASAHSLSSAHIEYARPMVAMPSYTQPKLVSPTPGVQSYRYA